MYNYIEKEIEDMIENNAHRYRSDKNNNNDDKEPPIKDLLSTESMSFLSRLEVCRENIIRDIYYCKDKTIEMDFDPNNLDSMMILSSMERKLDDGVHKKLIKLASSGNSIKSTCRALKISEKEYHTIYDEVIVKLRVISQKLDYSKFLPHKEPEHKVAPKVDLMSLDFSNEETADVIFEMFEDIH